MASNAAETLIGAAVLAVAGGFLVYAANTADVSVGGKDYQLTAEFRTQAGRSARHHCGVRGLSVPALQVGNLRRQRPVEAARR